MKIKDLCEDERPREKLLEYGAGTLSKAELLAIIFRTGSGGKNAVELAQEVMRASEGSLTSLSSMSAERLCAIDGIGSGKAATLIAALELGKRFMGEVPDMESRITSPRKVFELMYPLMKGLKHEECWAIYLNRSNRVIRKERLSSGGMYETAVDTRILSRKALERSASGIILLHNHPSGDPTPGKADEKMTLSLRNALKTFDISLMDHVIISDGAYYSFADSQVYHK